MEGMRPCIIKLTWLALTTHKFGHPLCTLSLLKIFCFLSPSILFHSPLWAHQISPFFFNKGKRASSLIPIVRIWIYQVSLRRIGEQECQNPSARPITQVHTHTHSCTRYGWYVSTRIWTLMDRMELGPAYELFNNISIIMIGLHKYVRGFLINRGIH